MAWPTIPVPRTPIRILKASLGTRKNCVASTNGEADDGVCGRNCDRAVQWSPSFEALDQYPGVFLVDAGEGEV